METLHVGNMHANGRATRWVRSFTTVDAASEKQHAALDRLRTLPHDDRFEHVTGETRGKRVVVDECDALRSGDDATTAGVR